MKGKKKGEPLVGSEGMGQGKGERKPSNQGVKVLQDNQRMKVNKDNQRLKVNQDNQRMKVLQDNQKIDGGGRKSKSGSQQLSDGIGRQLKKSKSDCEYLQWSTYSRLSSSGSTCLQKSTNMSDSSTFGRKSGLKKRTHRPETVEDAARKWRNFGLKSRVYKILCNDNFLGFLNQSKFS